MRALSEPELDKLVNDWHNGAGEGLSLHEYLGVSWEDYAAWVEQRASLYVVPKGD